MSAPEGLGFGRREAEYMLWLYGEECGLQPGSFFTELLRHADEPSA